MTATLLYRIAAAIFLLFAVGHTYGFLTLRAPSPEGRAVFASMNSVQFEVKGRSFTYGGFYRGFGLSATAAMILSVFLSWHLGELARTSPASIGILGWIFCAVQLVGVVLSYLYFGVPPAIFATVVAIILGAAAWLATSAPSS